MPRPHRLEVPGGTYHVFSRGNRKEPVFEEDRDRQVFLALLETTADRFGWVCLAYSLMDNHFHLVIETPRPTLARGMQRLKGAYGRWFNDRYGLVGHVFGGRYGSKLVEDESHALHLVRYVVLNPVRAGIVQAPEDHRWSSYRATIGWAPAPRFLAVHRVLEPYGGGRTGRGRFKAFVDDGVADPTSDAAMALGLTPAMAAWAPPTAA